MAELFTVLFLFLSADNILYQGNIILHYTVALVAIHT